MAAGTGLPVGIAFLTESVRSGGAERQLQELASNLDQTRFAPRILVWQDNDFFVGGGYRDVPIHHQVRRFKFDLTPVFEAARWLRSGEVDILHGYGDTGNLYAAIARRLAGRGAFVASERSSKRELTSLQRVHKPWAHRQADLTIANSKQGQAFVKAVSGIDLQGIKFVPNGIDMQHFCMLPEERRRQVRRRWKWPTDKLVLLTVGTLSAVKNHIGLAKALGDMAAWDQIHVCWIGDQTVRHAASVFDSLRSLGIEDQIDLRSPTKDIHEAYQAADVLVHASSREGTSNVVLEAMACGLPVLATDVGDLARYVRPDDTGWLIPADSPQLLSDALRCLIASTQAARIAMGIQGRDWLIEQGMARANMVQRHETLYEELAAIL